MINFAFVVCFVAVWMLFRQIGSQIIAGAGPNGKYGEWAAGWFIALAAVALACFVAVLALPTPPKTHAFTFGALSLIMAGIAVAALVTGCGVYELRARFFKAMMPQKNSKG